MALGEPEKEFLLLLPQALDLSPFKQDYTSEMKLKHKALVSGANTSSIQ